MFDHAGCDASVPPQELKLSVMAMTSDGNVKAERGAMMMPVTMMVVMPRGSVGRTAVIHRCGVNDGRRCIDDRSGRVNHRSGLIDDGGLDYDGLRGLGIN